ncbi:MAG: 30S ribosomal protein S17 [Caldilineales bacterium]|nr:30S ribosomal protein S17 [Caldilineales bacterium]
MAQEQRKVLTGTVVSTAMDKTVVVRVERTTRHPLYGKVMRTHKKYAAHDEHNQYEVGDVVRIRESRPLSKTKQWVVIEAIAHTTAETPEVAL